MRLAKIAVLFLWALSFGHAFASSAQPFKQSFPMTIMRESRNSLVRELVYGVGARVAQIDHGRTGTAFAGALSGIVSTDVALKLLPERVQPTLRPGKGSVSTTVLSGMLLSRVRLVIRSGRITTASEIQATQQRVKSSSETVRLAQADGQTTADTTADAAPSLRSVALKEVIVTAQRRTQRELDVPISLVVIGSQDLERKNITGLDDMQFSVPGLTVESSGVERRIEINGISNVFGNGASVGEYIDEADATSEGGNASSGYGTLDVRTYDLQRTEVLRGPQGTLYGEGSTGGTIRFITNKPVLERFQMSADTAALFTQYGAPSQRTEAMINAPIVTNTLGLRFAGEFEHDGGWMDQPAANLKNINQQNLVDVRIEGLWEPAEHFKVNAMQVIHRNAFGLNIGENANGNFTQVFNLTTTPSAQDNTNLSNVTMSYDFSQAELLSSTTYFTHDVEAVNWGYFIPVPHSSNPSAPVIDEYIPSYQTPEENLSEELRLARTGAGPWQWTLGGFYKHYRDSASFPDGLSVGLSRPPGTAPPPAVLVGYAVTDLSKSWSAFADTSYKLFNRLTVGAGVRYFRDNEAYSTGTATTGMVEQSGRFTSTDPRFYVQYQVSRNSNVYASAAKGFRSGGFNGFNQPRYNPEQVWTYELGTKTRLFGNHMRVDTDVFLSHYTDYVVNGLINSNGVLANVYSNSGTVRIKGIESEITWQLLNRWSLGLNGDYINGRFVSIAALNSAYAIGDPVGFVPRYTVSAFVEREFVWKGRGGFVRADYSQRASESYRNRSNGPLYYGKSDAIYMLNANLGIQWNQSLRLSIFAQNLLNNRGIMDPIAWEGLSGRPRPRTFGIGFGVSFL